MVTEQSTQQQISTVKKVKPLTLLFVLFMCGGLTVGFLLGFVARGLFSSGNGGNGQPTPTPSGVVPSVDVSVSPTPTGDGNGGNGEDDYDGWIQYVLSDCQIKLLGPAEFTPGLRGEQGTCGSFTVGSNQTISSFDNYPGMFMLFMPFLKQEDSLYGFKEEDVERYIDNLVTDPTKVRNNDLLLNESDFTLAGKEVKLYEIKRFGLGTANFIFYEELGREYVIIYSGEALGDFKGDVELLLRSVVTIEQKAS